MRADGLRDEGQRRVERCRPFGARERVACLDRMDRRARRELRKRLWLACLSSRQGSVLAPDGWRQ